MNSTDAAYLAGLLDGEGSYMIGTQVISGYLHWEPKIAMSSTDELLAWRCKEIAGGSVCRPTVPKNPHARPARIWTLKGKPIGTTIEAMWPFIVLKRRQAALLHAMRSRMRAGALPGDKGVLAHTRGELAVREMIRLAVRALNHRGTADVPEDMAAALVAAELAGFTTLHLQD